jgi:hypothetical protein
MRSCGISWPEPRGEGRPYRDHHYSSSYVAARFRFGLWRRTEPESAAVFSHPVNKRSFAPLSGEPLESVELAASC